MHAHASATMWSTLPSMSSVKYVWRKNYTKILAIRVTEAQHSSKFLTQLVKDVLQGYGLHKDHVLCIVTDNASNMVSMLK